MSAKTPADEIRDALGDLLPRLRRFARVITRNVADADDLVQVTVEKALARAAQWRPGSRLDSWMFGIMKNAWVDEVRARRRRERVLAPEEAGAGFVLALREESLAAPYVRLEPADVGPPWFYRMDRNRDGDLSIEEFAGPGGGTAPHVGLRPVHRSTGPAIPRPPTGAGARDNPPSAPSRDPGTPHRAEEARTRRPPRPARRG